MVIKTLIRIRIDLKCWIQIRIETDADPQHCVKVKSAAEFRYNCMFHFRLLVSNNTFVRHYTRDVFTRIDIIPLKSIELECELIVFKMFCYGILLSENIVFYKDLYFETRSVPGTLSVADPDPLVRGTDPDRSIIKQI